MKDKIDVTLEELLGDNLDGRSSGFITGELTLIIDIREKSETEKLHISELLPFLYKTYKILVYPRSVIVNKPHILDIYKSAYLICATGMRSSFITNVLRKNGYNQVYNVLGGIEELKAKLNKNETKSGGK